MIVYRKSRAEILSGFFNGKNFLIGLMVATFMVFASGAGATKEGSDAVSIIIGAGLFSLAAGLILWARDISKKLYS